MNLRVCCLAVSAFDSLAAGVAAGVYLASKRQQWHSTQVWGKQHQLVGYWELLIVCMPIVDVC
jgi:hypothetical protein